MQNPDPWGGLKIGVATYTLRSLSTDAALKAMRRLEVRWASIKDVHLARRTSAQERRDIVARFRAEGIEPLSVGNVGLPTDEAGIRDAFVYAKEIGVSTMVCAPRPESMPILDAMVKEFDLRLAIHNHGPEDKVFPTPQSAYDAARRYDKRIGLCIDVGHTARAGVDPAKAIRDLRDRVYDIHLKDISDTTPKGSPIELGRGALDLPGILASLRAIRFEGLVGIEYEKDGNDPVPGLSESIGYLRGICRTRR